MRSARAILRSCDAAVVVGMDEVGRGALAGPVTVGAVAVCLDTPTAPRGLHDSKLLTPSARAALVAPLRRWAPAWGVGHASNDEIDAWGILCALRVAGMRAMTALTGRYVTGSVMASHHVVLDGNYDWLRRPPVPASVPPAGPAPEHVHLMIKGDQRCAAVAAASVLAKVERDDLMTDLGRVDDRYGWAGNKGYAAPEHLDALREHGPSEWHRRSWTFTGNPAPSATGPGDGQDVLVTDADLVAG